MEFILTCTTIILAVTSLLLFVGWYRQGKRLEWARNDIKRFKKSHKVRMDQKNEGIEDLRKLVRDTKIKNYKLQDRLEIVKNGLPDPGW